MKRYRRREITLAAAIAFAPQLFTAAPTYAVEFYPIVGITTNTVDDLQPVGRLIQGAGVGFDAAEPHLRLEGIAGFDGWVSDASPPGTNYFNEKEDPVFVCDLGEDRVLTDISFWEITEWGQDRVAICGLRFATDSEGQEKFTTPNTQTYQIVFPFGGGGLKRQSYTFRKERVARFVEITCVANYGTLSPGSPVAERAALAEIAFAKRSEAEAEFSDEVLPVDLAALSLASVEPIEVTFRAGSAKLTFLIDVALALPAQLNWSAEFDCQISLYEGSGNLIDRVQAPANGPGKFPFRLPRRGPYLASIIPLGLSPGESGTGLVSIETDEPCLAEHSRGPVSGEVDGMIPLDEEFVGEIEATDQRDHNGYYSDLYCLRLVQDTKVTVFGRSAMPGGVQVTVADSNGDIIKGGSAFPLGDVPEGFYLLSVRSGGEDPDATGPYSLKVFNPATTTPEPFVPEHIEGTLLPGQTVEGTLEDGDLMNGVYLIDYWEFELDRRSAVTAEMDGLDGDLDSWIVLSDGKEFFGGPPPFTQTFDSGVIYVAASTSNPGQTGAYRLSATSVGAHEELPFRITSFAADESQVSLSWDNAEPFANIVIESRTDLSHPWATEHLIPTVSFHESGSWATDTTCTPRGRKYYRVRMPQQATTTRVISE